MAYRIDEAVGYNVRKLRLENGFSQQELAKRAGLSKQTISNIEKGTAGANSKTVERIAECLNVSPLALYHEPDSAQDISFKRVSPLSARIHGNYAQEIQKILDTVADDTRESMYSQHIQPVLSDFFMQNIENLIFQVKSAPHGREQAVVETFRDDLLGSLRASVYNNQNISGLDLADELIEE